MSVVYMMEYDNAKDESRYRKYAELVSWRKGLAKKYEKYILLMLFLIKPHWEKLNEEI